MIEKRPELFKIDCLTKLKELFLCPSPFFAGYGNRQNDLVAYEAVGIPRCTVLLIRKDSSHIFNFPDAEYSSSTRWAFYLDRFDF